MIKKTITFEDFEGDEISEDHYFHLYKGRAAELMTIGGGIEQRYKKLMEAHDEAGIFSLFKEIIGLSYGRRDPDKPAKFDQSPEVLAEFKSSPAFDALYMELMSDVASAQQFMIGILPSSDAKNPEVVAAMAKAFEKSSVPDPNGLDSGAGIWPRDSQDRSIEDVKVPVDSNAWPSDNGPQPPDIASGLRHPRDIHGNLVSWAFREPTKNELITMTNEQKVDTYQRKSSDWQPFQFKS